MNKTRVPNDLSKYEKNYSSSQLWQKLTKFAKKAGSKVVYVALVLYYVLQDSSVSFTEKAKIMGALGYLILPTDLLPDTIPMLGFTDDLGALLLAYNSVKAHITPQIEQKAREQLTEWFGSVDENELKDL